MEIPHNVISTLVFVTSCSFAVPLAAQIPDSTPISASTERVDSAALPHRLTTVVVQATRTHLDINRVPQSVTIVGEDRIQTAQRQVSIDEALRVVPGVFVTNRDNYSATGGVQLNIRGGPPGLQLLQDGIPLTMADGTTQPTNLDLGSAGRIEVIRGPSSVLYGNSGGGVVSVETAFPSKRPLVVHPEVQFGSDGYDRQQLKAEGTAGALGYVLNLNRMQTDGFRRYGAAEILRANLVAREKLSEHTTLRGVFNLYNMPFGENPSTLTREDARNDPTSVRQLAFDQGWGETGTQGQGGLNLEHEFAEGHTLRVVGWGDWRSNWNPIPSRIIDLHRKAAGLRSEYQQKISLGAFPVDFMAGFDVSYQHDDRHEFANAGVAAPGGRAQEGNLQIDQLEKVVSLAPFAQATMRLPHDLGITAGVRYDHYAFNATDRLLTDGDQSGDRRLSAASPMVGVTYSPRPELNLFTNYAYAYQTPTMQQLSNREDGAGGFNQDLKPEYLHSFEVGVRGVHPDWRLGYEITGYLSTVDDALVAYQGVNEQVFYRNAGESSRNGVEVALTWVPVYALEARLAYTYRDFEFVHFQSGTQDVSGNREPGTAPSSLFAGLTHTTSWGLASAVDIRWTDAAPVNDANTASNWAYTVVDVRAALDRGFRRWGAQPFAGINNLFDERYNGSVSVNAAGARYYGPSAGRNFYVGLRLGAGM
jgi:iron complex outermembrane recepter protein